MYQHPAATVTRSRAETLGIANCGLAAVDP
jgi:hypothetical protein